jgi:hypothetical protein
MRREHDCHSVSLVARNDYAGHVQDGCNLVSNGREELLGCRSLSDERPSLWAAQLATRILR